MTFADSVKTCLKKYADFSGRASRSEYWWFALFTAIPSMIMEMTNKNESLGALSLIAAVAVLVLLLPSIAVGVRRLHDVDRSGWSMLIGLIPLAGLLVLIWMCRAGDSGSNRFGPAPY